jgi:hypothetical protein
MCPHGRGVRFVTVWRSGRNRWRFVLAALVASGTFSLIIREEHRVPQRLPSITYINSWRADRSDAEIKASNLANQKMKEKGCAKRPRPRKPATSTTLGRISGMDVDAIEAKAKADARRRGQGRRRRGRTSQGRAGRRRQVMASSDLRWPPPPARLRARPLSRPIRRGGADRADGRVIARGWTQPGGRPHAEAMALAAAMRAGPRCSSRWNPAPMSRARPGLRRSGGRIGAGPGGGGLRRPDPRTAGFGMARIRRRNRRRAGRLPASRASKAI